VHCSREESALLVLGFTIEKTLFEFGFTYAWGLFWWKSFQT
jgi:hypothetical protein